MADDEDRPLVGGGETRRYHQSCRVCGVVAMVLVTSLIVLDMSPIRPWPPRHKWRYVRRGKPVPIALEAQEQRFCVGHGAVGSTRLSELTRHSKAAYAARHDYDVVVVEAPTIDDLARTYCPDIADDVKQADLSTGVKYCAVWFALEGRTRPCDWMMWTDPDAIVPEGAEPIANMVDPGATTLWFAANATADCGTPEILSRTVDTSAFMLRRADDPAKAFVRTQLALAAFLEDHPCDRETLDECATGRLFRFHPDWFSGARCRKSNVDSRHPDVLSFGSFLTKCTADDIDAKLACLERNTNHLPPIEMKV